jgi:hypothetical protein
MQTIPAIWPSSVYFTYIVASLLLATLANVQNLGLYVYNTIIG